MHDDCFPCAELAAWKPWRILIARLLVVGVLRNPKGVVSRDSAPVFVIVRALNDVSICVEQASNAGQLVDAVEEPFSAVGADAPAVFVVQNGDSLAEIVFAVSIEIIGLLHWVAIPHEVIEAPWLACLLGLLDVDIAVTVDVASPLRGLADYEIVINGIDVYIFLPV